jgi:hypothetical protein
VALWEDGSQGAEGVVGGEDDNHETSLRRVLGWGRLGVRGSYSMADLGRVYTGCAGLAGEVRSRWVDLVPHGRHEG